MKLADAEEMTAEIVGAYAEGCRAAVEAIAIVLEKSATIEEARALLAKFREGGVEDVRATAMAALMPLAKALAGLGAKS